MSALGQKQTFAAQKGMSALPPIATAKADIAKSNVRVSSFCQKSSDRCHGRSTALFPKTLRDLQCIDLQVLPPSGLIADLM